MEEFEHAVAAYVGAKHAVAVNSATSALHIACLALGLGPGDIMWTTPISFVASANCGRYCGADVDFVDIDPETFNMSPQELKRKLEAASKNGTLPKVLVVVHLAGEPAEMHEIATEARKHGVKIIEDASHALGSSYLGEKVGSGKYSDITVFSFHAVKNLTTGEGGMAVTIDSELAERLRSLRSHGIERSELKFELEHSLRTPWHYEQQYLGFNYRLSDFQSALGSSQLGRLDALNSKRVEVHNRYRDLLEGATGVQFQKLNPLSIFSAHLTVIRISPEIRPQLKASLAESGFATNLHYFPIHMQPYYKSIRQYELKEAVGYGATAISLPCFGNLPAKKVSEVATVVRRVVAEQ